mmetsp:Transcript_36793/g.95277  ORF Transcript_36793/g.95277 Transcript_36793/m.95277 type:complete len:177 (-) Transcript_36793:165-695(-)|eukprot:CAMPEP_0113883206 /NCGR_PEP_ID=MMETSP0780_2-20120614/9441_1 /TAXON_ID=652834 /ORGANISM="Palpitomonas bilix" /LENGTH=176 /DNA_ID=CAMNT_0000870425 /DNA_START=93 /DNA_END=623 /DNA_ORIENTATION=- /assembly_acc=CAM_ASM_000599
MKVDLHLSRAFLVCVALFVSISAASAIDHVTAVGGSEIVEVRDVNVTALWEGALKGEEMQYLAGTAGSGVQLPINMTDIAAYIRSNSEWASCPCSVSDLSSHPGVSSYISARAQEYAAAHPPVKAAIPELEGLSDAAAADKWLEMWEDSVRGSYMEAATPIYANSPHAGSCPWHEV